MNNENQNRLDHLFDAARNEEPKTSFNDVQKTFVAATSLGIIGLIINWIVGASKVAKIGIMISTITAVTVGVTMIVSSPKIVENNVPILNDTNHKTVLVVNDEPEEQEESVIEFGEIQQDSPAQVAKKPLQHILQTGLDFRPAKSIHTQTNEDKFIVYAPTVEKEKKTVVFTINENTQPEYFDEIKAEAEKAGVRFNHKTKYRKSIVRKTEIMMVINHPKNGRSSQKIVISGGKTFSHTFGWVVDENGKAVEVYSEDDTEVGALEDLEDWADDLVESLNLDAFETDSFVKMETNLEEFEHNLEEKVEDLVSTIVLNLERDIESTEESLKEWQLEVEDYSKKLVMELDSSTFDKLSTKELEIRMKNLESDLETLIEDLERELKKE